MTSSLPGRVAAEIRAELGRQKLSQAELARRLGKTEMYVSRRLADGTSLDLGDLLAIAEVLRIGVDTLVPTRDPAEVAESFLADGVMADIAALAKALRVPLAALFDATGRAA